MRGRLDKPWQKKQYLFAWIICAALVLLALVAVDRPVAQEVRQLHPGLQRTADALTHLGVSTWYLVGSAVFGLVALWLGRQRLFLVGLYAFTAIAASGIFINIVKLLLGRHRPNSIDNLDFYHFSPLLGFEYARQSMPSGHATTAGALAMVLCVLLPRVWPVWLLLGVVIAFTRVLLNVHYVSDVILGLTIGMLFGIWLRDGFRRWFRISLELFPRVDHSSPKA